MDRRARGLAVSFIVRRKLAEASCSHQRAADVLGISRQRFEAVLDDGTIQADDLLELEPVAPGLVAAWAARKQLRVSPERESGTATDILTGLAEIQIRVGALTSETATSAPRRHRPPRGSQDQPGLREGPPRRRRAPGARGRRRAAVTRDCRRCHAVSHGKLLCATCTEEEVRMARARRLERAASGVCKCGRRPRIGRRTCEVCAANYRQRDALARAKRKALGLCRRCPSPCDRPTSAYCADHRRLHNATNVERRRAFLRTDVADEAWGLAPSWAPWVTPCLPPEGR